MVIISRSRNNKISKYRFFNRNSKGKDNNQKNSGFFDAFTILFKEGSFKGFLECAKNVFISAYYQRKFSFGQKLQNYFFPL